MHVNARFGSGPSSNLCGLETAELILINLNAAVTFNDAPVSSLAETRRSCPMSELGHASILPLAGHFRGRDASYLAPTGSPEAVARLRFPQNVACGFTALRSSAVGSQHC